MGLVHSCILNVLPNVQIAAICEKSGLIRRFAKKLFNGVQILGFQMNPSRDECERALRSLDDPFLIAISVLAAGYLRLEDAAEYLASLPNIKGAAVGVSKQKHAEQTFTLLTSRFGK